jgi:hypothetical protein
MVRRSATLGDVRAPDRRANNQIQPTCGSTRLKMVNQSPHAADLWRSDARDQDSFERQNEWASGDVNS